MAKEPKVTCKIILHKTKKLKDGKHPIVIRITFRRKRKYYTIGESATTSEWEQIANQNRRKKEWRDLRKKIVLTEQQVEEVVEALEKKDSFTFDAFERSFFSNQDSATVFQFFNQLIDQFTKQGRIGNADIYKGTRNELMRFRKRKDLQFEDVTLSFLHRWETFLSATNSTNSISIYMRTLRSAYNKAIKEGLVQQQQYPFKDYQIKKEAPIKRALRKEHIQRINEFEAEPMLNQWFTQQVFIFSYLCQGMAFSDIAHLKWENIVDDRVVYKRIKTIRTSKNPKVISIKINDRINEILQSFRKASTHYDDYIFPILKRGMQPSTVKNTIKSKRKEFNKRLRVICRNVGIEGNITSYVARHSYATVLKRNGVSTSIISESLGH